MGSSVGGSSFLEELRGAHGSASGDALKTPVALLTEIGTKSKATINFSFEPSDKNCGMHKCIADVITNFGHQFRGIGLASTKQNAKHAAARSVLRQISPECESLLIPEAGSSLEVKQDPQSKNEPQDSVSQTSPQSQGQDSSAQPQEDGDMVSVGQRMAQVALQHVSPNGSTEEGPPIVVVKQDTHWWVNVPIPVQKVQGLRAEEVEAIVRDWKGPIIEKLTKTTAAKVRGLKDAFRVANLIAEEQKLFLKILNAVEKGDDTGPDNSVCWLEVYQSPPEEPETIPQSPVLFSSIGYGESEEEAKVQAAENFVRMVRVILRSALE